MHCVASEVQSNETGPCKEFALFTKYGGGNVQISKIVIWAGRVARMFACIREHFLLHSSSTKLTELPCGLESFDVSSREICVIPHPS